MDKSESITRTLIFLSRVIKSGERYTDEVEAAIAEAKEELKTSYFLDKEDLVNLVRGVSPYYSVMDDWRVRDKGWFNGTKGEWHWNYKFEEKMSDAELWDLYQLCKKSWKESGNQVTKL